MGDSSTEEKMGSIRAGTYFSPACLLMASQGLAPCLADSRLNDYLLIK